MKVVTIGFIFLLLISSINLYSQETQFDLNSNLNYRTISGIDGGNFLDISFRPNINIGDIFSAEAFINVPYNLSTNEIRKLDLKAGNIFRFVQLGDKYNFIRAGAITNYDQGSYGMVVKGYNNQLDEANKKVGLNASLYTSGISVNAMANDISDPKVLTGSAFFDLPIMDYLKIGFSGGIDMNPDNNTATDISAAAYGVDLFFALPFDQDVFNYLYLLGSAAEIKDGGNGQAAVLGFRFGSEDMRVDLQGSLLRLGPGFEWGFFDAFYERDRKLGISKTEVLKQTNTKSVGATNLGFSLGFGSETNPYEFNLSLGGFYFTDYASNDLNKFDSYVYMNLPRSIIGENGKLVEAYLVLQTRNFTNIGGLFDKFSKPDNNTVINLNLPIYLLTNVLGMGDLAFVMNYRWDFAFESSTQSFIPQRNLTTGFRISSSF